jgi:hypothetical protein
MIVLMVTRIGETDKAALFGGGKVTLPNDTIYDALSVGAASVEAWFKTTGYGVIVGYGDNATPSSSTQWVPALYVGNAGRLYGNFFDFEGGNALGSGGRVDDGLWHHAAITTNGSVATLYLDGRAVGSHSGSIDVLDMHYNWVGDGKYSTWPGGGGAHTYFAGTIDDVAVYGSALSAARVAAHFAAGDGTIDGTIAPYGPRVLAGSPVGYCRFGDDASSTWDSASGHTHSATFVNGAGTTTGALAYPDDAGTAVSFDGTNDYVTRLARINELRSELEARFGIGNYTSTSQF